MNEFKLSDDAINQIKDFDKYWKLTEEQKALVDRLILNEKLRKFYKQNGLCNECKQPKSNDYWCASCVFQQNCKNWTSGNHNIDEFIQMTQFKSPSPSESLEWIEYDRFENV